MNRAWLLAPLIALCGCGGGGGKTIVFSASSMQDAAASIAAAGKIPVLITPGGSDMLAFQISQGAKVDVLITADMDGMEVAGKAKDAVPFATAELAVAAKPGGPVLEFADLAKPGVRIAVASKDVPAGRYAQKAISAAGEIAEAIRENIVTEEPSARAALQKVKLGEVDAAFVYNTDLGSDSVQRVSIPSTSHQRATYYILAFSEAGKEFLALTRSSRGRKVLSDLGFGKP